MPQLTAAELYAVLAARQQVFAVEQHCAFLDADGHDVHAWHLLGWIDGGDALRVVSVEGDWPVGPGVVTTPGDVSAHWSAEQLHLTGSARR